MSTPEIRLATEEDTRFVHSSWHHNYWKTWAGKRMSWESYWPGQDKRIDRLTKRGFTLIAYFPEVPDEVLGWACLEGQTLHYVYVKAPYRKSGIATGLTLGRAQWYSHFANEAGKTFMEKVGLKFNPYLVE